MGEDQSIPIDSMGDDALETLVFKELAAGWFGGREDIKKMEVMLAALCGEDLR